MKQKLTNNEEGKKRFYLELLSAAGVFGYTNIPTERVKDTDIHIFAFVKLR